MIEIYLKYDNMHTFGIINALNCINNHVNSCINSMLSPDFSPLVVFPDPFPLVPSPPPPLSSLCPSVSSIPHTSFASDIDPLSPSSIVSLPSLDAAPHVPPDDLHLPIALFKGTHACTLHPISHFVSYD